MGLKALRISREAPPHSMASAYTIHCDFRNWPARLSPHLLKNVEFVVDSHYASVHHNVFYDDAIALIMSQSKFTHSLILEQMRRTRARARSRGRGKWEMARTTARSRALVHRARKRARARLGHRLE